MTADPRWARLVDLFAAATELPVAERATFVARAADVDPALGGELRAMLAAHDDERELEVERRLISSDIAARDESASLPPGTMLGAYSVVALIARGGMGEVYRAERVDGTYRQTVAIKVLRAGRTTAESKRRFRVEREVLARLSHPDIAAIIDGGTAADQRPYFVMPFVEGTTITTWCAERRASIEDRLRLAARVARAVQFAHGQLIVHRDIKPSNILVDATGAPRLLDFGIAKLLEDGAHNSLGIETESQVRLLTPEHAAPEQIRGEAIGTATDVYGLGVLLYELVSGRRPFVAAGRSTAELERSILRDSVPAPSTAASDPRVARRLRGDLDTIILMALRREPERRYNSAGQLAEDLERHLDGRPVLAQRDTLGYRARKLVTRNPLMVGAGTALALLMVAATLITLVQARRIAGERDRAERERASAEDVVQVLTGLFERGNPEKVPGGDTLRLTTVLDEVETRARSLAADTSRQLRLLRAIGDMRAARGEYERAGTLFSRAIALARGRSDDDALEAARSYFRLGRATLWLTGQGAARPILDSAVRWTRTLSDGRDAELPDMLRVLAFATEDAAARDRLFAESMTLEVAQPGGADSVSIAAGLSATATELFSRGRVSEARDQFEVTLRLLERVLPPGHPNTRTVTRNLIATLFHTAEYERAGTLMRRLAADNGAITEPVETHASDISSLGLLAAHQGRYDEAETRLQEALGLLEGRLAPTHGLRRNTLRNIGQARSFGGDVRSGLSLLDSALALANVSGEGASEGAMVLRLQRVPWLLELRRADEAAAMLREATSLLERNPRTGEQNRALLHLSRGMVAMARQDFSAAVSAFRESRQLTAARNPADHPLTAQVSCALGAALARAGDRDEAATLLRVSCPVHDGWGLRLALITRWGRSARASFDRR